MRQVGLGNSQSALVSSGWYDLWTWFGQPLSLENESTLLVPSPYTRTKIFIWCPSAPGTGTARVWTLRKNNVDVLVLTMADDEQEIRWVGSIDFAASDLESMQYTEVGVPLVAPFVHVGWEIDTADSFLSLYRASRMEIQWPTARYSAPLSSAYGTLSQSKGSDVISLAGQVEGFTVTAAGLGFSGEWLFQWYLNEVLQDGSPGTVDTRTFLSIPSSFPVLAQVTASWVLPCVPGDVVSVEGTVLSGTAGFWATLGTLYRSATPHQAMFPSANGLNTLLSAVPRYAPVRSSGHVSSPWGTVDTPLNQGQTFDMAFTLSDFWGLAEVALGAQSQTLTIRVNGSNTALSVVQTGAGLNPLLPGRVFADVTHTADVPVESAVNIEGVADSAPVGHIATNLLIDTTPTPVPVEPTGTTTELIRRQRRAPHLITENLWQFFHKFELHLQTGVGLTTGQGADPQIMLRWSFDGGRTWSNEHWTTAGALGTYQTRAEWRRLGRARNAVFEVTVSDPVFWAFIDAWVEVDGGIA